MFTILGGDGKEYGPASVEQLRAWIAGGRANLDTKARAVGSEEWRRLGDFPEFNANVPPPLFNPPVAGDTASAPAAAVTGPALASLGQRLGGACLNSLAAFLVFMPGFVLMMVQIIKTNPDFLDRAAAGGIRPEDFNFSGVGPAMLLLGVGVIGFALTQIILLSVRGQDLGKLAVGTRIVRLDGTKAGFLHAFVLRGVVPGLISMLPYVGMLFSLVNICFIFRADRRCIHDLIAGTRVVKSR